jgi:energy-coupling factor transport system permease protein
VVKLAWLLWATVAVFVVVVGAPRAETETLGWQIVSVPVTVVACAVGLLWYCGVAPWRIPGLRLWLILGMAILVAHAFATPQGHRIWGPLTMEGLINGVRALGRLMAVILMSALFVITTEPFTLAAALMRVGLPYRWGFTLVTALRLAPLFRIEAHHVYQAQLVRGVAYDASGPRKWWLILRHLSLPMLVSALRTAHALSLSMEGRAFGLHPTRTHTRDIAFTRLDTLATALLAASIFLAIGHAMAIR